ncbi:MAG TPA: helix-hairpin-helix domain-containing protein [Gammaproteobacteria bacterium]|nr:helix-hairpin-helix domain-containing protein [Gammaproteobacteria bacterium]
MTLSLGALAATVNINAADAETLSKELKGIGPVKAAAIVEYRKHHGAFSSPDQLTQVEGIGVKLLELNRARIVVREQE